MRVRNAWLEGGGTLIQVYTGNGKGKTTAAVGLAVRAAGAGKKVYLAQFCKGRQSGEVEALKKIKNIKLEQFGTPCFITKSPSKRDLAFARAGFRKVRNAVSSGKYGLIILDEMNVALHLGLISLKETACLLKSVSKKTEVVLTGRNAHPQIIAIADLVSEIKEIKHCFRNGTPARKGIEY